jgi:hypothetical protein
VAIHYPDNIATLESMLRHVACQRHIVTQTASCPPLVWDKCNEICDAGQAIGHPDGATGQRIVHKEQKAPGS